MPEPHEFPDFVVRTVAEHELEWFLSIGRLDPQRRDFRAEWRARHRRPGWTWMGLRAEQVVSRAAWWGFPDADVPLALDVLDFTDDLGAAEAAIQLLKTAHHVLRGPDGSPPDYHLFLPPDWRAGPAVATITEAKLGVAAEAGLMRILERVRWEWTPAGDPPARSDRLRFRPVEDISRGDLIEVLRRVAVDSLDDDTRRRGATLGLWGFARAQLEELQALPGPASWWRLGFADDGTLVGISIPSRNFEDAIIAYIGVVPEARGLGYVNDLLAEATLLLSEEGASRIVADTDSENRPMSAAFERAGYRSIGVRLVVSADPR